jgi:hypothetical protein
MVSNKEEHDKIESMGLDNDNLEYKVSKVYLNVEAIESFNQNDADFNGDSVNTIDIVMKSGNTWMVICDIDVFTESYEKCFTDKDCSLFVDIRDKKLQLIGEVIH